MQLTTAFREGGLRDRRGTFLYKDHVHKSNVPVLAVAGDRDLICPPEAVYGLFLALLRLTFVCESKNLVKSFELFLSICLAETVKLIPEHLVTYKVFGEPDGPHYAHYDLVGGRLVRVFLCFT